MSIYEKINFEISFNQNDTDKVIAYLEKEVPTFKRKGTHSKYTNSAVDYWEITPGKLTGRCVGFYRLYDFGRVPKKGYWYKVADKIFNLSSVTEIKFKFKP